MVNGISHICFATVYLNRCLQINIIHKYYLSLGQAYVEKIQC